MPESVIQGALEGGVFLTHSTPVPAIMCRRELAAITGDLKGGVFLTHLVMSRDKADSDGFITMVQSEWDAIYLTRRPLERTRKLLIKEGIIEYKRAGLPAKPMYRVNMDVLKARVSHGEA